MAETSILEEECENEKKCENVTPDGMAKEEEVASSNPILLPVESWDFGKYSCEDAEKKLMAIGINKGQFIVRDNRDPGTFSLSVRDNDPQKGDHVKHYRILEMVGGNGIFIFEGSIFRTLSELVHHYQSIWNCNTPVAVKTLKEGTSADLLAEANFMKRVRHERLRITIAKNSNEKEWDNVPPDDGGMVKERPIEAANENTNLLCPLNKEEELKETDKNAALGEQNTSLPPASNNKTCITKLAGIEPKYMWMLRLILFVLLISGANGIKVEEGKYRKVIIARNETQIVTDPIEGPNDGSIFAVVAEDGNDCKISFKVDSDFVIENQSCYIVVGDKTKTECKGLQIIWNGTHIYLAVNGSKLTHDRTEFYIFQQAPQHFSLYVVDVYINYDQDIDECASSPCVNGGTCVDGHDSYTCNCAKGYDGADCEIDITQQEFPRNITKAPNETIDATDLVPIPAPDCTYWKKAFDIVVPLLCLLCVILVIGNIRERLRNKLMERVLTKVPDEDPDTTALDNLELNVDFIGSAGVFSLLLRAGQSIVGLEILVRRCNGTYYIESSPRTTPPTIQPYNPPLKCSSGKRHGARSRAPRSARELNRAQNLRQSNSRRPSTGSRATTPERNEHTEIQYAGRKFAMNVTSCTEGGVPRADEPVNANAKYVVVMKTHLGDHSLILSTKVQAERKDSSQTSPENYVFIRTRKGHLDGPPLVAFRKFKMLEWWSQAYIAGIPEVLCGMRDDRNHEITSVKKFDVKKLSEMSRGTWDQRKCRDKFIAYLSEIKRRIQVDNPRVVHRLELPCVRGNRGVEERLRRREFIFHPPMDKDDSVILTDQYRRDVLNI
eukprot:XP_011662919.1 PREDICTED: uncharacterized protein LOC577714 [Strongylocentrotus purpuratus]